MMNQIFPGGALSEYRGRKVALWLFGLIVVLKFAISLGTMFNGYEAAVSADGIPLDTYSAAAGATVLSLLALLGLTILMFELVSLIVLIKYRALVPLMILMHLLYQGARYAVFAARPIERVGVTPGFGINLGILGVLALSFVLSVRWTGHGPRT